MADVLQSLLSGARIEVESTFNPGVPIVIDLTPSGEPDQGPGALVRLVRPQVSVFREGQLITQLAPAGSPREGLPWGLLILAGLVTVGVLLTMRE